MDSPDNLALALCRYVTDASGHEHLPGGSPEGGQFTGKEEHGQSPDDMAQKLTDTSARGPKYPEPGNTAGSKVGYLAERHGAAAVGASIVFAMQGEIGDMEESDPAKAEKLDGIRSAVLTAVAKYGELATTEQLPAINQAHIASITNMHGVDQALTGLSHAIDDEARDMEEEVGTADPEDKRTIDTMDEVAYELARLANEYTQIMGAGEDYSAAAQGRTAMHEHFSAMHPDQLAQTLQEHMGGEHQKNSGVEATMHEWKHGTLKSGSGHPVTSKAQALAIGLSEERKAGKP